MRSVPGIPTSKKPKRIMPREKADSEEPTEAHKVYLWRLKSLEDAGMEKNVAKIAASDPSVDIHRAVGMLGAGLSSSEVMDLLPAI